MDDNWLTNRFGVAGVHIIECIAEQEEETRVDAAVIVAAAFDRLRDEAACYAPQARRRGRTRRVPRSWRVPRRQPATARTSTKDVTHAESAQFAWDFILDRELTDLVLLGRSYGETMLELFPPAHRELFTELAAASTDNTVTLPFDVFREVFINDADLDMTQAYVRLSSEPFRQLQEALDFKRFHTLEIPRSHLLPTEDTAMPHGEWGWHPRLSSRLGTYRLGQMSGSHELMFSNPVGLADKILEAGRD